MRKLLSLFVLAAFFLLPLVSQAQTSASITFAVNDATMGTTTPATTFRGKPYNCKKDNTKNSDREPCRWN